ncbi:MAG: alanine-glyoxylate transaminase / serine-glyoxylate transaminase / serine-pyruvate transaminase [Actinomycetota bacterium]|nr:alanine-glyoxylate transaminase / serine-glyoxylate transaminase / serine-pyruvate transaminase [Actinomycetota bacterium]
MSDDRTAASRIDPAQLPPMPALMIAGPGELHEEDLRVLGTQVPAHYGDVWVALHSQVLELLGKMLGSADLPYLIPGTGTTCLDAAVFNLFEAGQKVVVPATGFFGTRLAEVARAHRLEVVEVPVEVGAPIDPARVADALDGVDGVLTVHVETATGVRHPIEDIGRIAREAGVLYLVDGIASVGGEALNVDEMGLDAIVTGSQKGLETPPGLGILALGSRGRERVEARGEILGSWYLNLKTWDWYRREWGSWHPHPVTMPTNLVLVLAASLNRIMEFGLEAWVARRAELAKRCREGLRDLGLEPIPQAGVEANLIVAAWADDPAAIQKYLLAETGIMISGGLTPTAGKAIRVGLMGATATEEMVDRVVDGIAKALAAAPSAPVA